MDNTELSVLIVDDEEQALKSFAWTLETAGYSKITTSNTSSNVRSILDEVEVDVVILDLMMPKPSGDELLPMIASTYPHIPVIIVTGVNEIESAVDCLQKGASDYLVKPVDRERLIASISRVFEIANLRKENIRLSEAIISSELRCPEAFENIITRTPSIYRIFHYCEAVGRGKSPILITGDTGVGKSLLAEAIHKVSDRHGTFVQVNVAGLDDQHFADTLFGHAKGAFTGAIENRPGLIESADKGTLFLDEIGDLTPSSQTKLLQFLESGTYYPLGSDKPKQADARIVVATNRDLHALQETGIFRSDLYFRLQTHRIYLPNLSERKDDIPLLLDHFASQAAVEFSAPEPLFSTMLYRSLRNHPFPGNLRELKALAWDAVGSSILGKSPSELIFERLNISQVNDEPSDELWPGDKLPTLQEANSLLITTALEQSEGNISQAARTLGITPQALSQRLKRDK